MVEPEVWMIMKTLELCSLLRDTGTQTFLGWLATQMAHAKAGGLEAFWEARQKQL